MPSRSGERKIKGWDNVSRKRRVCRTLPHRRFVLTIVGKYWTIVIVHHPWQGWVCCETRYRRTGQAERVIKVDQWEVLAMRKVKVTKEGRNGIAFLCSPDTELLKALPALVAHFTTTCYEDGSSRTPGWWTVKSVGATCCVQVKDPDSCCSFSVLARTLDEALITADALLSSEEAPWEPDRWLAANKPRGKKKVDTAE